MYIASCYTLYSALYNVRIFLCIYSLASIYTDYINILSLGIIIIILMCTMKSNSKKTTLIYFQVGYRGNLENH